MQVTKCDICKKEIKDYKEEVRVLASKVISGTAFCLKCGGPIIKFLKNHKLIQNQK